MSDIETVCGGCNKPLDSDLPNFNSTVNVTLDTLFVEIDAFEFGESIAEMDVAWDWCSLACFGRWVARAAVHMGTPHRPVPVVAS